jgi:hypothetical protein
MTWLSAGSAVAGSRPAVIARSAPGAGIINAR